MKNASIVTILGILGIGGLYAAQAYAATFSCTPAEIRERSSTLQVRCSNSISLNGNTVSWLALGVSDSERARRFLSIATTALVSKRRLIVDIPTVYAGQTGVLCNSSDCRIPTWFSVSD